MRRRNFRQPTNVYSLFDQKEAIPSFFPSNLYATLVMDQQGLIGFDVTSSDLDVRNLVETANNKGFGSEVFKGDEVIAVQQPVRDELRLVANPRQPYDMGYGVPNARMAKSQLRSIIRIGQRLEEALMDGDNLPQWVHTKVATSLDRLNTAANYLESKIYTMSQRRSNPADVYIEDAPKMCAYAYTMALVLSPIKVSRLLRQATKDGFDPNVIKAVIMTEVDAGEIDTDGDPENIKMDDTIIDVDFIE